MSPHRLHLCGEDPDVQVPRDLFTGQCPKKPGLIRLLGYLCVASSFVLPSFGEGITVDHTCTDLSKIPGEWINAVRDHGWNMYYMYRSHGSQVTYGFQALSSSEANYAYSIAERALPSAPRAVNIFGWYGAVDGSALQGSFWDGDSGRAKTRDVLTNNPTINLASWASSGEGRDYRPQDVADYLNSMAQLEAEFPNVTFIYTTFNAQPWDDGVDQQHTFNDNYLGNANQYGFRTQQNNILIREWCREHNKVLFDFGDIDCWYNGEQAFSLYQGQPFPREHGHYNLDEEGHSSKENCVHKGVAMWWLLARLSGWAGPPPSISGAKFETPGQFKFGVTGNPNGRLEIQASTNFLDWATVLVRTNTTGIVSFSDAEVPSFDKRFYRVLAP